MVRSLDRLEACPHGIENMFRLSVFAVVLAACVAQAADAPAKIPAFPGAEGAGAFAAGGRGGSVFIVTNVNTSGPGSLADAVSKPNRIVVFAVSGTIDLSPKTGKSGKLIVEQPHITIAGQT